MKIGDAILFRHRGKLLSGIIQVLSHKVWIGEPGAIKYCVRYEDIVV